jgi:hypothetical protein
VRSGFISPVQTTGHGISGPYGCGYRFDFSSTSKITFDMRLVSTTGILMIAKYIANAQRRWVRGIQTRIDVTASMLGSMKVRSQFKDGRFESLTKIAGSENAWPDGCSQQHGSKSASQ